MLVWGVRRGFVAGSLQHEGCGALGKRSPSALGARPGAGRACREGLWSLAPEVWLAASPSVTCAQTQVGLQAAGTTADSPRKPTQVSAAHSVPPGSRAQWHVSGDHGAVLERDADGGLPCRRQPPSQTPLIWTPDRVRSSQRQSPSSSVSSVLNYFFLSSYSFQFL